MLREHAWLVRALLAALPGGIILVAMDVAGVTGQPKALPSCPACVADRAPVGRSLAAAAAATPSPAASQPSAAPADLTAGMALIPAGTFWMGSADERFPDAAPVHRVKLDAFYMDRTDVTNAKFAKFVEATGYVTVAERKPDPALLPGVPAEALVPGAVVFSKPGGAVPLDDPSRWWRYVPGANWRHPEGPASDLRGRENYPVVQVAWPDAAAYATWAGKRLPTEAEWEYAARGGLDRKPYVWGDALHPGGKAMANTFQGHFPDADTAADGYAGASPVGAFPPNGYGLYDMAGNVWQWCSDWYRPDTYRLASHPPDEPVENPQGPSSGFDPADPAVPKRVMKGGSFLCTDEYCGRFVPGSRGQGDPNTPLNHAGFRCVVSVGK